MTMNRKVTLPFERPIHDLEQKIEELRLFGIKNEVDVEHGLSLLQTKLNQAREQIYQHLSPYQRVQLARHPERPYTLDYIERLCTDFYELKGDRRFADDAALIGGFARFGGRKVMVIGHQKGRGVRDNMARNFGMPHPEGYRKAMRLMLLADKAKLPIISFIDTAGAYPGLGSEERHVGEAIAVNLRDMFTLGVPVLCVVIGEGGSGGALGISVGNRVLIMENAYYSVITPEGCAAILFKSSGEEETSKAAAAMRITARDLAEMKIVDEIVPEPEGGANQDPAKAAAALGKVLEKHLAQLEKLSPDQLRSERYERFRRIGVFAEASA